MLSSIMLASGDNKYNIDADYIVAKLKEKCVESLELVIPIKSFDDIISKSIKYIKENRYYDNHYTHIRLHKSEPGNKRLCYFQYP